MTNRGGKLLAVVLLGFLGNLFLSNEAPAADAANWPAWRGPHGNGHGDGQAVPLRWDKSQNVLWKAEVPGRGHSSPVVFGDRIFLTTADEGAKTQSILAYDRRRGDQIWQTIAHRDGFMRNHQKNSHASATPACDGERVYSVFINGTGLHVTATDLDGNIVWQREAGKFVSEHGYGSSPVLYESVVIVNGESLEKSFITALDRETGETVWRTPTKTTGNHGGFGTPIVRRLAGKDQLLLMGIENTSSYNPRDGKPIWTCKGPAEVNAGTVVTHGDLVIASGGYPEKEILGIRADGTGDVTESHVVWRKSNGMTYVPTALVNDGHLFIVNDQGVASCLDVASGRRIWQERLRGNFSASPTLAAGYLFVPNEAGMTYVLRASSAFDVVAENDLGDGGFATPSICDSQIFLRTNHALYCIAERN